jgi:hypothetical protein
MVRVSSPPVTACHKLSVEDLSGSVIPLRPLTVQFVIAELFERNNAFIELLSLQFLSSVTLSGINVIDDS